MVGSPSEAGSTVSSFTSSKTSCVRVKYADGYHIDFAIYRRAYDAWNNCWVYEHAGADWTLRELKGLTEWFKKQNDASSGKLRKVIRLSKMFCKSRSSWKNMPSGLIQTVLCDEKLQGDYDRIDELFYYTMKEIVNRLESNTTVAAPVDGGRDLTPMITDSLQTKSCTLAFGSRCWCELSPIS